MARSRVARGRDTRNHLRMLAAALTLWSLFSLWIMAPLIALPRLLRQTTAALLIAELLALFFFSYGTEDCDDPSCAPLARAAGVAARADLPALSVALFALTVFALARGRPVPDQPPARTTSKPSERSTSTTTSRWSP
jgi:hypothetical protein